MGKYMKKSKLTGGDIAVMEVSPQSSPRLRTRAAKTLALQRLNKSSSQSPASSSSSYLQLRSRRLEKPPLFRHHHSGECCSATNSRLKQDSASEKRVLGLEFGVQNGKTAEKIPSNLVRESSSVETSLSTRKETDSHTTDSRVEMELLRSIPTSKDMEEFFSHEELWHQRTFIQKYNFDFANDAPLQGRYEWLQVVP